MEPFKIKSVKTDGRRPQVKEFDFYKELGTGNFSRIVAARHKTTNETFAIKVIEKKQVESLKRRHPNIHNEIQMEKRILVRLAHPLIVTLYSTFQDYNALYFLMELCSGAEMWTKICHGGKLVGCPESLSTFYLAELIEVRRCEERTRHGGAVRRADNIELKFPC
jgi:serine/threonine protein kinase